MKLDELIKEIQDLKEKEKQLEYLKIIKEKGEVDFKFLQWLKN